MSSLTILRLAGLGLIPGTAAAVKQVAMQNGNLAMLGVATQIPEKRNALYISVVALLSFTYLARKEESKKIYTHLAVFTGVCSVLLLKRYLAFVSYWAVTEKIMLQNAKLLA